MNWEPLARALAARLVEAGDLADPRLINAIESVPRHVFVPWFRLGADGPEFSQAADLPAWLAETYTDQPLTTQVKPHPDGLITVEGTPFVIATSSSTGPGLMARMLEVLDLQPGCRVLEIGTGTGYNAALLSHVIGAENIVSVDLDPELVMRARARLATLGFQPVLVAGDGTRGHQPRGPYDRIIATAAVPEIPAAWIDQLAPDGKIVANLRGELSTGAVCVLNRSGGGSLTGRFLPLGGHFMWVRPQVDNPLRPHQAIEYRRGQPSLGGTVLDPTRLVADDDFRFLLQLQIRGVESFYVTQDKAVLLASDGSRADVELLAGEDGLRKVSQHGPRNLWNLAEETAELATDVGELNVNRYGITVTETEQTVWLDSPEGPFTWTLPLV